MKDYYVYCEHCETEQLYLSSVDLVPTIINTRWSCVQICDTSASVLIGINNISQLGSSTI